METTYTKKTVIAIGATTVLHVAILVLLMARLLLDQTADDNKKFPLDMPDIPENWAKREAPVRFVEPNDSEEEHEHKTESECAKPEIIAQTATPEIQKIAPEIESSQQEIAQDPEEIIEQQIETPEVKTHGMATTIETPEVKTHGMATTVENKPEPAPIVAEKKAPIQKMKKAVAKKVVPQTEKKELKLSDLADMYKMRMNQQAPIGDFFMQGNPHHLPPDQQIIFERYRTKLGAIIEQVKKENPMPCAVPLGVLVKIYLSLSQSGRFKDLRIVHSTGYESIDSYCMTIYKIASERFPPIPSCLKESMFKGTITLQSTQNPQAGGWFCFN